MSRIVLTLGVVALSLLTLSCGSGKPSTPAAIAKESPVTALLKANKLEGKPVLIEFGTIGCELSEKGLDAMTDWQKRNALPGLAFVRLEANGDPKTFDSYYGARKTGFPVIRENVHAVASALGTTIFPSFALLDQFGHVRYQGSQPDEAKLAGWVRQIAAETADPGPRATVFGREEYNTHTLLCETKLPDLTGSLRSLTDLRGPQGMLLTFVDTRCPFSAKASQDVPTVAAALDAKGVSTVLVNIGDPGSDVRKLYSGGVAGATVVYDTTKATQQNWKAQFVPLTVLVNNADSVLYRGSPVWGDVAAALDRAAGQPRGTLKLDAPGTNQG